MKKTYLKMRKVSEFSKKKLSRILPDSAADIAVLSGIAVIVICVLFGLEGEGDDQA